jgi:hypothetical protein
VQPPRFLCGDGVIVHSLESGESAKVLEPACAQPALAQPPIGCSLRAFAREAYPAQCKGCGNRPSFRRQLAQHHRDLTRSSHEKFSPHRPGHVICRLSMVAHGAHTCPWKEVANSLNLAPAASNASRQRNIADAPRLNSSVWIEVVSHELIAQQDSFATP